MKLSSLLCGVVLLCAAATTAMDAFAKRDPKPVPTGSDFVIVSGPDLLQPDGTKLFIKGTNLGNWLNPEGYMFGFKRTNAPRQINDLICELAGPDFAAHFWAMFKDRYITRRDVEYIAACGANTIRMPLHYKLFTDEDYMGLTSAQDGMARIDSVVSWCRDNNLYLILDMHDAPGGQTGDNIDDSYGYPWLFESEACQQQLADIWRNIAARYNDESVILGYELINEPIAHYFDNKDELNALLEPLHKRLTAAIREVDTNHIILAGAPQWNGNFDPLKDTSYDPQLMFTCHRYGGDACPEAIGNFIEFRDRANRPMYMGEIGHNTDEWQASFVKAMTDNNIGYTFWPYKKRQDSCMMGIEMPEGWDKIVEYSEGPHATFEEMRNAKRPCREEARRILTEYLDRIRFENCNPQESYILSMGLTPAK